MYEDLIGKKFNKLTVVGKCDEKRNNKTIWICKCDCGSDKIVYANKDTLKSGHTKSCGCIRKGSTWSTKKVVANAGDRFGQLTVVKEIYDNGIRKYLCKCDCGNYCTPTPSSLKSGTKSCGCIKTTASKERCITHGMANTRLYNVWSNIKARCNCKTNDSYPRYGGRGIKLCKEWDDFETFYRWAYENGYDENAEYGKCTIDRIDVNGNYEPSNCRWVDSYTQGNNKRNNIRLEYDGETHSLKEWSEKVHIKYSILLKRYHSGWGVAEILTTPVKKQRRD